MAIPFPDPGYRDPDRSASFEEMVRNLDHFDHSNYLRRARVLLRRAVKPRPGMRFLDAGCGTGLDVATMAQRVAGVEVLGVDVSRRMVDLARGRHGGIPGVEFRPGDVGALDLADGSFDASWAVRTLQYLEDPLLGLRELARVTKRSGRVVVIEGALSASDLSESVLTRAIFGPRAGFGMQLPELLRQAGLRRITVYPAFAIESGEPDSKLIDYARARSAQMADSGEVSNTEARQWLAELGERASAARWFSIDCMLVVAGTVPGR